MTAATHQAEVAASTATKSKVEAASDREAAAIPATTQAWRRREAHARPIYNEGEIQDKPEARGKKGIKEEGNLYNVYVDHTTKSNGNER